MRFLFLPIIIHFTHELVALISRICNIQFGKRRKGKVNERYGNFVKEGEQIRFNWKERESKQTVQKEKKKHEKKMKRK